MNKKGISLSINMIVLFAIGFFVLVLMIVLLSSGDSYVRNVFGNIIPTSGGGGAESGSVGLVRLELKNLDSEPPQDRTAEPLDYYVYDEVDFEYLEGSDWKRIDLSKDVVDIGDYELDPVELKAAMTVFYFASDRKPEIKSFSNTPLENSFLFEHSVSSRFRNKFVLKAISTPDDFLSSCGYVGLVNLPISGIIPERDSDSFSRFLRLGLDDKVYVFDGNRCWSIGDREEFEVFDSGYAGAIGDVIEWRDQILEGELCERHISVQGREFALRKVAGFLVLNLENSAVGKDRYDECEFDQYELPKYEAGKHGIKIIFNYGSNERHIYEGNFLQSGSWSWNYQGSRSSFELTGNNEVFAYQGFEEIFEKLDSSNVNDIRIQILTFEEPFSQSVEEILEYDPQEDGVQSNNFVDDAVKGTADSRKQALIAHVSSIFNDKVIATKI